MMRVPRSSSLPANYAPRWHEQQLARPFAADKGAGAYREKSPYPLSLLGGNRILALFAVAGLAEHFDLTLLLLRARLGWAYPTLFYQRENRTANRLPLNAIAPEIIEVIRQRHTLDLSLYDFAQQRLRQQAAQYLDQPERALARFVRWNRLYQRGAELFNRARRLAPRPLRDQAHRWRQARNRPR